ncbi:MAG: DUF4738 domain-containing protein [Flavobacteriales bacterium]|nr:DUF4738 domain-containing protein [Flavobacteriales bacterium]
MFIYASANWTIAATMVIMLSVGCVAPSLQPEVSSATVDTSGSWPSLEIEAEVAAREADTVFSETALSLYNEPHRLTITGTGSGGSNFDRSYRIQLTNAHGPVVDTVLTRFTFADSLDADFLAQAGLYALDFDLVRAQSLYFNAFIGVDETDYVQHIGFFLTYTGERKGRMIYWVVPEEEVNDR